MPYGYQFNQAGLSADFLDHPAMDVGEGFLATLMEVGQVFVVDTHKVKDRRVDVVNMSLVDNCLESELIRFTVTHSAFHTTAGHPHAEPVRVVVAARGILAFAERHPAKLASPYDQR